MFAGVYCAAKGHPLIWSYQNEDEAREKVAVTCPDSESGWPASIKTLPLHILHPSPATTMGTSNDHVMDAEIPKHPTLHVYALAGGNDLWGRVTLPCCRASFA